MTDEQVKKGLERCIGGIAKCDKWCPYYEIDGNCSPQLKSDALALINRLEEENKKLSDKNKELRSLCCEKSNGMKHGTWVRMLQEAYCAEAKAKGKTAKDILQSFAQFRAVSPALSKVWYALAEKYGVEVK